MLTTVRAAALAFATCALVAALTPATSAQSVPHTEPGVVIRERVELPPSESPPAALGAGSICATVGGTTGPFTVPHDGAIRATIVLSTYGEAADPAYVRLDATPEPGYFGLTVRGLDGALRRDSVSMAGYFAYQWGTADWGDPDTLRVYGPADGGVGGNPWLVAGEVAAGEAVEALWFRVAGVPFPGAHPLAPAGTHPFTPLCAYPAQGVFNTGDGLAQGNTGPVRIEASLLADAGPGRLVVTPDTLGRGGEAGVALSEPAPPPLPVTLSVEDPAYGGFVTVPAPGDAPVPPQPSLSTTAGELSTVRFRVADDAPLGTVTLGALFPDGSSLEGSLTVVKPDTLVVSFSQEAVSSGSSVGVEVTAYSAEGERLPRSALADSTFIGLAAFSGPFGELVAGDKQGHVLRGVTWGEISDGAVSFLAIASPDVTCDYQDISVLAGGAGIDGGGTLRVFSSADGLLGAESAPCSQIYTVERKDDIRDWIHANCPGYTPDPVSSKEDARIDKIYERSASGYLGNMGWGRVAGYSRPVDGYLRSFEDTRGNQYPQVSVILESKRTEGRPVSSSGDFAQARAHISFLAAQRLSFFSDMQALNPDTMLPLYSFAEPVLIYVSQNRRPGEAAWELGSPGFVRPNGTVSPDMQATIFDDANAGNVQLIHAKVALLGGFYRTLAVRTLTPLAMVDSPNAFVDELAESFSLRLDDFTYFTFEEFEYQCDALSLPGSQPAP